MLIIPCEPDVGVGVIPDLLESFLEALFGRRLAFWKGYIGKCACSLFCF